MWNSSNIGCTYKPPDEIKHDPEERKKYLGGENHFKVTDIEVYEVITN